MAAFVFLSDVAVDDNGRELTRAELIAAGRAVRAEMAAEDRAADIQRASNSVDMLWGLLGFQWAAFKASKGDAERDVRAVEWLDTKANYDEACEVLQSALLAR